MFAALILLAVAGLVLAAWGRWRDGTDHPAFLVGVVLVALAGSILIGLALVGAALTDDGRQRTGGSERPAPAGHPHSSPVTPAIPIVPGSPAWSR